MSDFFSELAADAKLALNFAKPIVSIVAPIAEAADPELAPIIGEVEAGVTSIESVVPGAVTTAQNAITEIESIVASGSAEVKRLGALFGQLFQKNTAGQATVLTPTTTSATAPALTPAPGNAKS